MIQFFTHAEQYAAYLDTIYKHMNTVYKRNGAKEEEIDRIPLSINTTEEDFV
jgi:hypothetical protein